MTVNTETILSSSLYAGFRVRHVDTTDRRAISNVGRLDVMNARLGDARCTVTGSAEHAAVDLAERALGVAP